MAKYGLTPQGPNPKRLDVILEDMHSKMTDRLGVNTRQNPQSLLNHILTNVADEIAELWEFGVDVYHSQYTSSATGVSLDYAAQFGGSTREMAAKSYYSILCTGDCIRHKPGNQPDGYRRCNHHEVGFQQGHCHPCITGGYSGPWGGS